MSKTALISGCNGQDGSYLAEFLLEKGYVVHGLVRRNSTPNHQRIEHLKGRLHLHESDLTDQGSLTRIMFEVQPDEVYNLAAQSFVGISWDQPISTSDVTGLGAVRVFEAARQLQVRGAGPRVYQASTSELFGDTLVTPQNEETPLKPHSPYGAAKLYAHEMAGIYRKSHGMFIACGILFNHESERRGKEFVTRKITRTVAEILVGRADKLMLGNVAAARDWGYAPDYVEAMWLTLQQEQPDDFVIGTGVSHTVKDFVEAAFDAVGIIDGFDRYVGIDEKFFRPVDISVLLADATKARDALDWEPKTPFKTMVRRMVASDLDEIQVGVPDSERVKLNDPDPQRV